MSDGATVNRTALINIQAVVMSVVMLLGITDCTGYMAEGGKKDGEFIATEMLTAMGYGGLVKTSLRRREVDIQRGAFKSFMRWANEARSSAKAPSQVSTLVCAFA